MAVCYAISAALRRAFGAAAPDLVAACGDNTSTGIVLSRRDNQGHRIHIEIVGGGNGASARGDGADGIVQCLANSSNMPIEALETNFGFVRVASYGLILDSGGAGMHRGGRGIRRRFEVIADGVTLHTTGDGHMTPPWGLDGGSNGTLSTKRVLRAGAAIDLPALSTIALERGDIIEVATSGGGGFGDPRARPRDRVRDDLADGAISIDVARAVYGADV
jgi:N-methylhydantoinase B